LKSIRETPVPLEFKNIFLNKLTGELRISSAEHKKSMFFRGGRLIHCKSDFFDESLGVILNLIGKVSDSQYDNISGLIHSVDEQVGTVLVQNGIISREDLEEAVRYRTKKIAVSSFSIISGDVVFTKDLTPGNQGFDIKIPVEEIICSGGKRIESVNYISRKYYFNSPGLKPGKSKLYKLLSIDERDIVEIVKNSEGLSNPRLISRADMTSEKYWEGIAVLFLLGIVDFSADKVDKPTEEDIVGLVRLKNDLEKGHTDVFSIIGVTEGDSVASIQRAYISLTKKYDPARFGSDISPEIKKSAQFVLKKLGNAFREINILRNKKSIPEISHFELADNIPENAPDQIQKEEQSSADFDYDENFDKFERGKELYYSNKFDEALLPLKEVVKSGDPGYENYLYLGMCQSNLPFFSDEAERNLKKAVKLAPGKSEPVHALGHLYVKLKRKKSAKKCFERAVELEPGNIKAAQDLFRIKYPPKKKRKLFSGRK